jgi:hypothetical protein
MHVPDTGTRRAFGPQPDLVHPRLVLGNAAANEWSVLYAKLREGGGRAGRPAPGELRGERMPA